MMQLHVDLRPTEEMTARNIILDAYNQIKGYHSLLVIVNHLGYLEGLAVAQIDDSFDDLVALQEYARLIKDRIVKKVGLDNLMTW